MIITLVEHASTSAFFIAEGIPENKAKAAELFEKAFKLNQQNSKSIFNLAVLYAKGDGVVQNVKKSVDLYKRAAALNNADALLNLAVIYDEGICGAGQDKKEAFEYFKRSADLGNAKGQLIVGIKYEIGDECEKDLIKAREYFE